MFVILNSLFISICLAYSSLNIYKVTKIRRVLR